MPLTIIETRLGELIAKIDANDREIDYLNSQMLPTGAERLRKAHREVEAWRVNQSRRGKDHSRTVPTDVVLV